MLKGNKNEVHITGLEAVKTAKDRQNAYNRLHDTTASTVFVRGKFIDTKNETAFLHMDWHKVERWIGSSSFICVVDGARLALRLRKGDRFDILVNTPVEEVTI